MSYLVDTHVLLWVSQEPHRLSPLVRGLFADPRTDFLVSVVTAYEIRWKHTLGKLGVAQPLIENFPAALDLMQMRPLDVTLAHAELAGRLDPAHRDPFDRLIAAQALFEGIELITSDEKFSFFGVQTLW